MHYESPEREENLKKKKKAQILFKEIMAENISNLGSDLDIQVYEAHQFPPNF